MITITQIAPGYGPISVKVFHSSIIDEIGIRGVWWNQGGKLALGKEAYEEFQDARKSGTLNLFFQRAEKYRIDGKFLPKELTA